MDRRTDDDSYRDDALMRRLFAALGRRDTPDDAALRRAEDVFREALAPVVQRRKRKRVVTTMAIAASVFVVLGLGLVFSQQESPVTSEDSVASIVTIVGPVEVVDRADSLSERSEIHLGETLATGSSGRASIRYRDADVRLDVATSVRFEATKLVLEQGALYVDSGNSRAAGQTPVLIETRFGMLGHTGTQFMARLDTDHLVVAVREGTVFVKSGVGRRDLSASSSLASVAEVDAAGDIRIHDTPRYGGMWSWVPQASPGFAVEGKSVDDYLAWIGREYGYDVEYVGAASRSRAQTTLLRGDLSGLSDDDALAAIGATSRLSVNLGGSGVIRVSSESDHDSDPGHDGQ